MLPSRLSRGRSWLATVLLVAAASVDAAAQEIRLPGNVGVFVMTDSSRYERSELGIMYTYVDASARVGANAYVYPVPAARLGMADSLRVAAEAESFAAEVSASVDQGWYSDVNMVVNRPETYDTGDGPRPGHLVIMVLSRDNRTFVSFMHLVLLGDQYVKTRLTLAGERWRTSMAPPLFSTDLFGRIAVPSSDVP